MNDKVVVLGGGSFGTVVANMIACNGFPVTLWMRDSENAHLSRTTGCNQKYLAGYGLSDDLTISANLGECVRDAGIIVFSVFDIRSHKPLPLILPQSQTPVCSYNPTNNNFFFPNWVLDQVKSPPTLVCSTN